MWQCPHCPNIFHARNYNIKKGSYASCGCRSQSEGAEKCETGLKMFNIVYSKEKTFPYLRNTTNGKNGVPRFDFYIDNTDSDFFLLEYHGKQHYVDCGDFGRIEREETDPLKAAYCKDKDIRLYIIGYLENIEYTLSNILIKEGLLKLLPAA